jgi:ABC-type multidrug transport system ATPase subunit
MRTGTVASTDNRNAPGECLGVIGPNGAGKTTTIRMCLGLTAPDAGRSVAYPLGRPRCTMPRDALAIKAQLGVVSQFDTLDPDFTCAENLLVYGRYFGMKAPTSASASRSCWSLPRSRTRPRPSRASCRAA